MITLTPVAVEKVAELVSREDRDDLALRVAVQPGGCSGLIYELYFDERILEGDERIEIPATNIDINVVVDKMSVPYLQGAVVDYSDSIDKQGFTIDNPNAGGACACGGSFS